MSKLTLLFVLAIVFTGLGRLVYTQPNTHVIKNQTKYPYVYLHTFCHGIHCNNIKVHTNPHQKVYIPKNAASVTVWYYINSQKVSCTLNPKTESSELILLADCCKWEAVSENRAINDGLD